MENRFVDEHVDRAPEERGKSWEGLCNSKEIHYLQEHWMTSR